MRLREIKPGYYLLALLLVYAVVVSAMLARSNRQLRELRTVLASQAETLAAAEPEPPSAPSGLWFPIPGARVPQDDAYLPGAARVYRNGVNEGFDFYDGDAGVPVLYGTPVVAAEDATVTRLDRDYEEPSAESWSALLAEVAENGADEAQLNRLRGRQLWLETDEGLELRYGHLSAIAEGLAVGERVYRGQVIGAVGNSGTDDGVAGGTRGARLHFEVWRPDGSFFGQGEDAASVRAAAQALFVGP